MICEPGHPTTTLRDWETFRREHSPYLIAEAIDRQECNLPPWFVPLARGVVIASAPLLRRAGYLPGTGCPPHWYEKGSGYFKRPLVSGSELMVRECEGTNRWTVERQHPNCSMAADDVLVHLFGSTPIFTPSYQSAMWLAEYCQANDPPNGLRWIKAIPDDLGLALELARMYGGDLQPMDRQECSTNPSAVGGNGFICPTAIRAA
jgi:hypothetical protein